MSGGWDEDDGPAAVWDERVVVARKAHTCSACRLAIPKGTQYVRHVRINEVGDRPEVWKRCPPCELVYRHLCGISSDPVDGPEPDLSCGHEYTETHGKPPPPEIAALAFALPGEVKL